MDVIWGDVRYNINHITPQGSKDMTWPDKRDMTLWTEAAHVQPRQCETYTTGLWHMFYRSQGGFQIGSCRPQMRQHVMRQLSQDIMRQDMLMCRWPQLVAREYPAPHTHTYSCLIDTICLTIQWHAVHLFRLMHFVTSRTFLWIRRTSYCTVPPRPHSPSSAPCTPQRDSMTWCNDRWFNDMIQRHNQMAWFNQWQD